MLETLKDFLIWVTWRLAFAQLVLKFENLCDGLWDDVQNFICLEQNWSESIDSHLE